MDEYIFDNYYYEVQKKLKKRSLSSTRQIIRIFFDRGYSCEDTLEQLIKSPNK